MTRPTLVAWLLAALGVVFLSIAITQGWDDIVSSFRWSPGAFALAVGLNVGGLASVAGVWALLHDTSRRRAYRRFLLVQPAKHVPGGFAQPVGLVTASAADMPMTTSMTRFVRQSIALLIGGLAHGLVLVFDAETSVYGICATILSVLGLVLLANSKALGGFEKLLSRAAGLVSRGRLAFTPEPAALSPARLGAIVGLSVLGIAGLAGSFAIAASAVGVSGSSLTFVGAFGVAWAVGYAAFPVPAGLGVRESVLLIVLPAGGAEFGLVIAASVIHRLSLIVAELITFAGAVAAGRGSRAPSREQG